MIASLWGETRTCLHTKGISSWQSTRWARLRTVKVNHYPVTPTPNRLDTWLSIDFTDGITKDWGGKPFIDLQRGWKYALDKYPEIDPTLVVRSQQAPAEAVTQ
ncbi:hypothetical protein BJV78DRAFT_1238264 [Lactifluus subvellereus]|nr:hypothetical protein BJV78DRAFT_1238264 [Lactifluus subvellereus]